ncbi:uncharacterized protein LOC123230073 [Mangifera indica]|uniref:uncharacterized protein LOC123230073 n=1 Tax=Mangifera indica TaxID=29780 RepID=UPI001CFA344F|nr:uncharacterized protein LOC123230073 [Mangifera indica]
MQLAFLVFSSTVFHFRFLFNPASFSSSPLFLLNTMADSSASYIRMVHHLIEECILFNMSKEECMEALSKHANIKTVITATVWKELEKENKEFFEAYSRTRAERQWVTETERKEKIRNMLSNSTTQQDTKADNS